MDAAEKTIITVEATINAPIEKVWKLWTEPQHISQWNHASEEWHCPSAENDLREGGKFSSRMAARDGSMAFDFWGIHDEIMPHELIASTMGDKRTMEVTFKSNGNTTTVTESFEAEGMNPVEMQRNGWQSILNNFKSYAEYCNKYQPLAFSISINCPAQKVSEIMLGPETYKEWTGAAWPGSTYEGEWKEGEALFFGNAEKSGTKAKLLEHRPADFTKAEHIAFYDKGKEITEGDFANNWIGSRETYTFTETDGQTKLDVVIYVTDEWATMFKNDWPKALNKLKEVCEA